MRCFSSSFIILSLLAWAVTGASFAAANEPLDEAVAQTSQRFEREIRPLVQRSCMACHDAQARPEGALGYVPGIRCVEWHHIHKASKILDFQKPFPNWSRQETDPIFFLNEIKTVLQKSKMPPEDFKLVHALDGRLLNSRERTTIIDWAAQSIELISAADPSRMTPSKFFRNRCLGCHNVDDNNGGLIFQVENGILSVPKGTTDTGIPFLTPYDPNNSAIYLVLQEDARKRNGLEQMPYEGSATDSERQFIGAWIDQGAAQ